MRGLLQAALAVALAGCGDPDPDVSSKELVHVDDFEGYARVIGPAYEMRFPTDDTGLKLPTSFLVDQVEVLAPGTCVTGASLAGIVNLPAAIAAGDEAGTSTLTFPEQGKAVVQAAVEFDVPFNCNNAQQHLRGTTTYTFFPSGRIVRHDSVSPADNALDTTGNCGCSIGPWSFELASAWTFDSLDIRYNGDQWPDGRPAHVCANVGANIIVGIAWPPGGARILGGLNPMRMASVFEFDGGPSTSLTPGYREVTSAVQIGLKDQGATCASVHTHLDVLVEDRREWKRNALTIDGVVIESNKYGLYVDDNPHGGGLQIVAEEGNVPPFAVILDIGTQRARVSRNDYTIQPTTDGRQLFWFNDGLAQYDTITITPY